MFVDFIMKIKIKIFVKTYLLVLHKVVAMSIRLELFIFYSLMNGRESVTIEKTLVAFLDKFFSEIQTRSIGIGM